MSDRAILKSLIASLEKAISEDGLTAVQVDEAIESLSEIRAYDQEKFPRLLSVRFKDTSSESPETLAEALLWKLGKWKVYKKFAANYEAENPSATKTDVVLFAFVKHLKNRSLPIYDQHAVRGLWAIDSAMENDEAKLRSLLFDGKDKWKATGSGNDTIDCYHLFVNRVSKILSTSNPPSFSKVDQLLMPLGQSIKRATDTYAEFRGLCGRSNEG